MDIRELYCATKVVSGFGVIDYIEKKNLWGIADASAKNLLSKDKAGDIGADGYMAVLLAAYSGE